MIGAFGFATIATHFHKNNIPFDDFLSMRIKIQNFLLVLGLLFVWYLIFAGFSLYNSRRLSSRLSEVTDVIKACFTGTIFIFVFSLLFKIEMITPTISACILKQCLFIYDCQSLSA